MCVEGLHLLQLCDSDAYRTERGSRGQRRRSSGGSSGAVEERRLEGGAGGEEEEDGREASGGRARHLEKIGRLWDGEGTGKERRGE